MVRMLSLFAVFYLTSCAREVVSEREDDLSSPDSSQMDRVDIAFVLNASSSMVEEIEEIKAELRKNASRLNSLHPDFYHFALLIFPGDFDSRQATRYNSGFVSFAQFMRDLNGVIPGTEGDEAVYAAVQRAARWDWGLQWSWPDPSRKFILLFTDDEARVYDDYPELLGNETSMCNSLNEQELIVWTSQEHSHGYRCGLVVSNPRDSVRSVVGKLFSN